MRPGKWCSFSVCAAMCASVIPAAAGTVHVAFVDDGRPVLVEREVPPGMGPIEAAVLGLVAGPDAAERQAGLCSHLPAGVQALDLAVAGGAVSVDLSAEILNGLDEAQLGAVFDQFRVTLGEFPDIAAIRLTCDGRLLASYLPPAVSGEPAPAEAPAAKGGLAGRNITIGPSHGRFWNGSGWYWQRSDPCGYGEAVLEDTNSIRLCQFLYQYLAQDGATVHVPRELNESTCCHSATGLHWWKMAARYWLQHNGIPSWVWDSSTTDLNDDIRARPLYADYRGSDIYVSCHTNAGGGGTATGTETFRDTEMEHPAHEAASYNLALAINNNIVNAIRNMYDGGWANRGVKDAAGGFGEIRIPNRPACLIELAFHDNCAKDASYLTDNFFRSVAEWGVYKGICEYFGTSPTWDKYSDELVGDTIPPVMSAGQSYGVSITFRNRGVVWSNARSFRLGAVGDSDPFTGFNRVNISGEVRPGQTYTFNFTMTAPSTPGYYTTDWRMVRDGVTWFGATLSRQIQVGNPPATLLADDFEAYTDQGSFEASWTDTGNSEYQLDTGFGNGGKSVRMPSPSGNYLGRYYRNLSMTATGTDEAPLIFRFDFHLDPAGAPGWNGARHFCELRGYSGGGYGAGGLQNLVAVGLYNASADTWSTTKFQGRVLNDGDSSTQWRTLDAEPGAPDRSSGWHAMQIEVRTSQIRFYIDGVLAETVGRHYAGGFNTVVLGSDLTANGHQVYVDNVEVLLYAQPPAITGHPTPQDACPGETVLFHVQASGQDLSYRWQKNGTDLSDGGNVSGSGTEDLQVSGVGAGDAGGYRCVVTNSVGSATSNTAALTLLTATAITAQPQPLAIPLRQTATFTVSAAGEGQLTYRWQMDGADLLNGGQVSGADTPVLQISDIRVNNLGDYRCVVSAGCGTVVSQDATLTLNEPPGDFDGDGDVDMEDFGHFQVCLTGATVPQEDPDCHSALFDGDSDVDQDDLNIFRQCMTGADLPADPGCCRP